MTFNPEGPFPDAPVDLASFRGRKWIEAISGRFRKVARTIYQWQIAYVGTASLTERVWAQQSIKTSTFVNDFDGVQFEVWGKAEATANNKRVRIRFGTGPTPTVVFDTGALALQGGFYIKGHYTTFDAGAALTTISGAGAVHWSSPAAVLTTAHSTFTPSFANPGVILFQATTEQAAPIDISIGMVKLEYIPSSGQTLSIA